jgi:hypothetical protein
MEAHYGTDTDKIANGYIWVFGFVLAEEHGSSNGRQILMPKNPTWRPRDRKCLDVGNRTRYFKNSNGK